MSKYDSKYSSEARSRDHSHSLRPNDKNSKKFQKIQSNSLRHGGSSSRDDRYSKCRNSSLQDVRRDRGRLSEQSARSLSNSSDSDVSLRHERGPMGIEYDKYGSNSQISKGQSSRQLTYSSQRDSSVASSRHGHRRSSDRRMRSPSHSVSSHDRSDMDNEYERIRSNSQRHRGSSSSNERYSGYRDLPLQGIRHGRRRSKERARSFSKSSDSEVSSHHKRAAEDSGYRKHRSNSRRCIDQSYKDSSVDSYRHGRRRSPDQRLRNSSHSASSCEKIYTDSEYENGRSNSRSFISHSSRNMRYPVSRDSSVDNDRHAPLSSKRNTRRSSYSSISYHDKPGKHSEYKRDRSNSKRHMVRSSRDGHRSSEESVRSHSSSHSEVNSHFNKTHKVREDKKYRYNSRRMMSPLSKHEEYSDHRHSSLYSSRHSKRRPSERRARSPSNSSNSDVYASSGRRIYSGKIRNHRRNSSVYSSSSSSSASNVDLDYGRNSSLNEFKNVTSNARKRINKTWSTDFLKLLFGTPKDYIIKILMDSEEEFKNLCTSPLEANQMIIVLEFIVKLCSIDEEFSKLILCDKILSSDTFVYNISCFIEHIIAINKNDSYFVSNINTISCFYGVIINYIPDEQLKNYYSLLTKVSGITTEIKESNAESIENLGQYQNILDIKIKLYAESLINYKSLSVFPTEDEIFQECEIVSIIEKGSYNNVSHYIDVQFKVLKEDFTSSLRLGMSNFLTENEIEDEFMDYELFVHENVQYDGICEDNNPTKNIRHVFVLDPELLQNIDSENSKRLMHGSLLLFSCDNFKTFFLGIVDSRINVESNEFCISVVLVGNSLKYLNYSSSFVMIESKVFFEPYYQVCRTLQNINPQLFPLAKYIVDADITPEPLKYLKPNSKFIIGNSKVMLNCPESWPKPDKIGLNESQSSVLQAALSRQFVVIQGPPGTGKTYMTVKIINTLLDNKSQWKDRNCPIFVGCFRNNAVDNILELLTSGISGKKRKVVRLGSQSTSEIIKDLSLKNTIPHKKDPIQFIKFNALRKVLSAINKSIITFLYCSTFVRNKQGVLNYQVFIEQLTEEQKQYFSPPNAYLKWLLGNDEDYLFLDKNELMNYLFEEVIQKSNDRSMEFLSGEHPFVCISVWKLASELKSTYGIFENLPNDEMPGSTPIKDSFNNNMNSLRKLLFGLYMNDTKADLARLMSENLGSLNINQRWTLYHYWTNMYLESRETEIEDLLKAYDKKLLEVLCYKDLKDGENLRSLEIDVVGATTTGAARLNQLLTAMKPKIAIFEEAAEVLEPHVIASLTQHCEHLILIGDHKQLKPKSGLKYKRHVSLFERMILNGMEHFTLTTQYRMRPEISALLTPYFYQELFDHPTVTKYPDIKGTEKNLFFLDHRISEDNVSHNCSRQNTYEANLALHLAAYIIQQGYSENQVTVLSAYEAQVVLMTSMKHKYPDLKNIGIKVIDSFQGEENDIIILSLVRSNSPTIGFLAEENRVCVALSRAKQGFFMIGNMKTLQAKSKVWKAINTKLSDSSSIGTQLPLKCQTHGRITNVKSTEDFYPLLYGGCSEECGIKLSCGHICNFICHPADIDHVKLFKCNKLCERNRNCNLHECPAVCGEDCPPCGFKVTTSLNCGHEGYRLCAGGILECEMDCPKIFDCNHRCPRKCHMNDFTHEESCEMSKKVLLDCNHEMEVFCGSGMNEFKCTVEVEKILPCSHKKIVVCSNLHEEEICNECVKKILKC